MVFSQEGRVFSYVLTTYVASSKTVPILQEQAIFLHAQRKSRAMVLLVFNSFQVIGFTAFVSSLPKCLVLVSRILHP